MIESGEIRTNEELKKMNELTDDLEEPEPQNLVKKVNEGGKVVVIGNRAYYK